MVVTVDQIREGGLSLDETLSESFLTHALAEVKDTGFRPDGPAVLHVKLQKTRSGVLLRGSTEVAVHTPCRRCLADVHLRVPISFTLNLVAQAALNAAREDGADDGQAERGGSFALERVDEELFDGKTIDVDPLVREQVLLALPMHAACGEDCKGLCGTCGQNLNEGQCGCAQTQVDPRLAALKNFKLN
jgi:Predicted metal-binding, possibly nucleic acid-binding protein